MNQEVPIEGVERRGAALGSLTPVRVALLLGLATLAADQVWSIMNLRRTSAELATAISAQEGPLLQARRIETQLDALATGTFKLAQAGNRNAQAIVADLQAKGVSIDPEARKRGDG